MSHEHWCQTVQHRDCCPSDCDCGEAKADSPVRTVTLTVDANGRWPKRPIQDGIARVIWVAYEGVALPANVPVGSPDGMWPGDIAFYDVARL